MRPGCVLLAALLVFIPSQPAPAASDYKAFHASICQPRGPGTTTAELTYGAYGLANPGDTDETVICPIVSDVELALVSGEVHGQVFVRYRPGTVPGRIACTLFTGAYGYDNTNSGTHTVTSPTHAANGPIAELVLTITPPTGQTRPPAMSLVCVLGPKVMLGGFVTRELHGTNVH